MKIISSIALFFILTNLSFSQYVIDTNWTSLFGGVNNDAMRTAHFIGNGDFIIAGYTESFGNGVWSKPDTWVIKFNSTGNIIWEKTFGVADSLDKMNCIIDANNDGFILSGVRGAQVGFGGEDAMLLKIDTSGNEIWTKRFGDTESDGFLKVQKTLDNNYIICGYTRSFGAAYVDAWVMKVDNNGNEIWSSIYGGADYDIFYNIYPTSDGGYFTSGFTNSKGNGGFDVWICKLDSIGTLISDTTFGTSGYDRAYDSYPTGNDEFILTGKYEDPGASAEDVWLIKVDNQFNILLDRKYHGGDNDEGHYIEKTSDNGYVIGAWKGMNGNPWDEMWIIKVDSLGNQMWDTCFGGAASDYAYLAKEINPNQYLLGGNSISFGMGMQDLWLIDLQVSIVTGMQNSTTSDDVVCFPNPCNGLFTIKGNNIKEINIYNISGQEVKSTTSQNNLFHHKVDITNHSKGVYFIEIISDKGSIAKKLFKL